MTNTRYKSFATFHRVSPVVREARGRGAGDERGVRVAPPRAGRGAGRRGGGARGCAASAGAGAACAQARQEGEARRAAYAVSDAPNPTDL